MNVNNEMVEVNADIDHTDMQTSCPINLSDQEIDYQLNDDSNLHYSGKSCALKVGM